MQLRSLLVLHVRIYITLKTLENTEINQMGATASVTKLTSHSILGASNEQTTVIPRAQRNKYGREFVEKAHELLNSKKQSFDAAQYNAIWQGSFSQLQQLSLNKSMVRIFTSSTFVDTKDWRNELMKDVYPFFQELLAILGLDFRIVDMRWGVRESTGNDHGTSDLCFSEIYKCHELSLGPSFVTFLGDRYGYRPFPRVIAEKDLDELVSAIHDTEVKALITKWFLLDNNHVPPVYILQPVSTYYPDYINATNAEAQKKASNQWWKDFELMQRYLRQAAIETNIPTKFQFITSVTNEEVQLGIMANERRQDTAYAYLRDLLFDGDGSEEEMKDGDHRSVNDKRWEKLNLKEMKEYSNLWPYSDWDGATGTLDKDAYYLQRDLKQKVLPALSNFDVDKNRFYFPVEWKLQNTGYASPVYHDHVQSFLNHFTQTIAHSIFSAYERTHVQYSEYCQEVLHHSIAVQEKAKCYLGESLESHVLFDSVLKYLRLPSNRICPPEEAEKEEEIRNFLDDSGRLFLISGESGCGKTTLVSKLAVSLQNYLAENIEKTNDVKYHFIVRLLGTTSMSGDVKSLLISIIIQMSAIYEPEKYAQDNEKEWSNLNLSAMTFEALGKLFINKCKLANAKEPVIIILDSLDQLSDENNGRALSSWLPLAWRTKYVFIITSFVPSIGPSYGILREKYKKETDWERAAHWYECKPFTSTRCLQILDALMSANQTHFSVSEQWNLLTERVYTVGSPLYLTLAFGYALKYWHSYTPLSTIALPESTELLIESIFAALEYKHGYILVSHALGYITCSGSIGLSENELEDILSCDEDVLQDVFQWWTPPIRRLPPLLWSRIRNELGAFLVEKGNNGANVYSWYHRQFHEVAERRYLGGNATQDNRICKKGSLYEKRHSMIANYFSGNWEDGVPFHDKQTGNITLEKRQLKPMKSLIISDEEDIDPSKWDFTSPPKIPIVNQRKLCCQVYHEVRAGLLDPLLTSSLCNIEFLIAKTTFAKQFHSFQQDITDSIKLVEELEEEIDSAIKSNDVEMMKTRPELEIKREQLHFVTKYIKFLLRNIHQIYIPGTRWPQIMIDDKSFLQDTLCKERFENFYTRYTTTTTNDYELVNSTTTNNHQPCFQRQCLGLMTELAWKKKQKQQQDTTSAQEDPRLLTIHTPATRVNSVHWLPDQYHVLAVVDPDIILCYHIITGKEVFKLSQVNTASIHFSKDNTTMLYLSTVNYVKEDTTEKENSSKRYERYHYKLKVYHFDVPTIAAPEEVYCHDIYDYFSLEHESTHLQMNETGEMIYLLQKLHGELRKLDIISIPQKAVAYTVYVNYDTSSFSSFWYHINASGTKFMYMGGTKKIYYYDCTHADCHQDLSTRNNMKPKKSEKKSLSSASDREDNDEESESDKLIEPALPTIESLKERYCSPMEPEGKVILRSYLWQLPMQSVNALHQGFFAYPNDRMFVYHGGPAFYIVDCLVGQLVYHVSVGATIEFSFVHPHQQELFVCDGSSDKGYRVQNYGNILSNVLEHQQRIDDAQAQQSGTDPATAVSFPIIRKEQKGTSYATNKSSAVENKALSYYAPQMFIKKLFFQRDYLRSWSIDETKNIFFVNSLSIMYGYSFHKNEGLVYHWENDSLGFTLFFNKLFSQFVSCQENSLIIWDIAHVPKILLDSKKEAQTPIKAYQSLKTLEEKDAYIQQYHLAARGKIQWLSPDGTIAISSVHDIALSTQDADLHDTETVFLVWDVRTGAILNTVYHIPTIRSVLQLKVLSLPAHKNEADTETAADVSKNTLTYWYLQYKDLSYTNAFLIFDYSLYTSMSIQSSVDSIHRKYVIENTKPRKKKKQARYSWTLKSNHVEDEDDANEEEEQDEEEDRYSNRTPEDEKPWRQFDAALYEQEGGLSTTQKAPLILYLQSLDDRNTKDYPILTTNTDFTFYYLGIGHRIEIYDNTSIFTYHTHPKYPSQVYQPPKLFTILQKHISFITGICVSTKGLQLLTMAGNQNPRERCYEFHDMIYVWDLTTYQTNYLHWQQQQQQKDGGVGHHYSIQKLKARHHTEEEEEEAEEDEGVRGLIEEAQGWMSQSLLRGIRQKSVMSGANQSMIAISAQGELLGRITVQNTIEIETLHTAQKLFVWNTYASLPAMHMQFLYPPTSTTGNSSSSSSSSKECLLVLAKSPDGMIKVWNAQTGTLVTAIQSEVMGVGQGYAERLVVNQTGEYVIDTNKMMHWSVVLQDV